MIIYLFVGLLSLVGWYVNNQLKRRYATYSQLPNPSHKTGAEIAREMLNDFGIHDVQVVEGQGFLSDHFNPQSKTISLSPAVFRSPSVMAAAVAAHECGHAVQHAHTYGFLQFRTAMVPVVKGAAAIQQWLLLIALMLAGSFPQLLIVVLISFLITTLFSLITLPVEFDASNRAIQWLESTGNVVSSSLDQAKDALKWAGMTYVAAAMSSLVMFIFLLLSFLGNRD